MNAIAPIDTARLPVAIIGAGPVGLAAAAHLLARGLPVKLYEAADEVAAHTRDWGHVRLFSPWSYNIDAAARALLQPTGWQAPSPQVHPTGAELYAQYLRPLAQVPQISAVLETGARVTAVSRQGFDKMKTAGRDGAPFELVVQQREGGTRRDLARAVIDCTGTWNQPNPAGSNGLPVPGEAEHAAQIAYGLPDVLGRDRNAYANRRVLVAGAGHSAANILLDLARLQQEAPMTRIIWAVRGASLSRLFGGGANDKLAARGRLGRDLEAMIGSGGIDLRLQSTIASIADGLRVSLVHPGGTAEVMVDRIIVAAGQRPALGMLGELRLDLDPATESPRVLAPMIDPNVHSCGTVRPHGHRELSHPETGFYIAGIKSYGRAPTFLLATGYEQVRSIAAAIAGDMTAADDVQLDLPETGVCSASPSRAEKSGSRAPAVAKASACCTPKPHFAGTEAAKDCC